MAEVFIVEGARTPFAVWSRGVRGDGRPGGALRSLDPFDLGATALRGALARAELRPDALEGLIFGNVYHVGAHACYGARYVCHRAGVPPEVPSFSVALACGTGLQALIAAASEIEAGRGRLVAAVGADSPSNVRRDVLVPSFVDVSCGRHIAQTAQDLARSHGFTREDLDAWALLSHERALKARSAGLFVEEIVPAGGLQEDDAILARPDAAFFEASRLLFEDGTATPANTHAIVDGGSALILAGAGAAPRPIGRYLGGVVVGVEPRKMATASAAAVRELLKSRQMTLRDIDLFEINETFASQVLIGKEELGIPAEKLNVNGGALALGHPYGGTGCRLVLTLLKELRRRSLRRGIASICVAGGLGVAVAVESA